MKVQLGHLPRSDGERGPKSPKEMPMEDATLEELEVLVDDLLRDLRDRESTGDFSSPEHQATQAQLDVLQDQLDVLDELGA